MKYKFYEDDKFTYVKIFEGKFKGNYIYIPRAKTFIKIKYLEFKNFNYEVLNFQITEKDVIFRELMNELNNLIENKAKKEIFYNALEGYPY